MSREQLPVTSHQSHVTPNFSENIEVAQKVQNTQKGGWGYELAIAFVYHAIKDNSTKVKVNRGITMSHVN